MTNLKLSKLSRVYYADSVEQAKRHFNKLNEEEKRQIHYRVWDIAGRPHDGDLNWGATHAFDDMSRLQSAVSYVATAIFSKLPCEHEPNQIEYTSQRHRAKSVYGLEKMVRENAHFKKQIQAWATVALTSRKRARALDNIDWAYGVSYNATNSMLDLQGFSLRSLPNALCAIPNLETLYLEGNNFETVPEVFSKFMKLKKTSLDYGLLKALIDTNYDLKTLGSFSFSISSKLKHPGRNLILCVLEFTQKPELLPSTTLELRGDTQQYSLQYHPHPIGWAIRRDPRYHVTKLDYLQFELAIILGNPEANLRAIIEELSKDEKNEVFHRVWHLAGKPLDGDLKWGEHHAYDDLPRLYKAYNPLDFPEDFQNYTPPPAG